ncbi:alcohol dehydrogenase [Fibrisoma montanum]|uniref:Alcohol dehydrogenase n=1 Tax=Fibrisoma montanum TaxID=2305895 RepID=A0A418M8Q0_9BACT|nr:zinc-binding dehydrogenase [Fibrisoma montanum]RIV22474.1 alcohol dehydrogenase [Fibrisoma montanum]
MKAIVLEGQGKPLQLVDLPTPTPATGQVQVQLKAAALNRRDWWLQQGASRQPSVPGSDGTGIITAVGEGVSPDRIGKEVVILPSLYWGDNPLAQSADFQILGIPSQGTFAEYIVVPAENVYDKPTYLSFAETAALPLAALTGYRALFTQGNLKPGQNVLLTGIGGGVALFMLQIANQIGANVYVTSGSAEKLERAKQYGARGGVNYHDADWVDQLKAASGNGFDLIVDSAAGNGFADLVKLAKIGGRIVFFGATRGNLPELVPNALYSKQLALIGTMMGSPDEFAAVLTFYEQHQLRPVIDDALPLAEADQAIRKMTTSEQFGKIVLSIA